MARVKESGGLKTRSNHNHVNMLLGQWSSELSAMRSPYTGFRATTILYSTSLNEALGPRKCCHKILNKGCSSQGLLQHTISHKCFLAVAGNGMEFRKIFFITHLDHGRNVHEPKFSFLYQDLFHRRKSAEIPESVNGFGIYEEDSRFSILYCDGIRCSF